MAEVTEDSDQTLEDDGSESEWEGEANPGAWPASGSGHRCVAGGWENEQPRSKLVIAERRLVALGLVTVRSSESV